LAKQRERVRERERERKREREIEIVRGSEREIGLKRGLILKREEEGER
jgi:hypothetical protein